MINGLPPEAQEAVADPEWVQITIKGRNGKKMKLRHHIDPTQQIEFEYAVDSEVESSMPFRHYPAQVDRIRRWTTFRWGPR